MLPKVIYVMGPPGAGKGTQAAMLSESINYFRFSTGDAFREVSRQNTDLGRQVKETIDNGFLAPPDMAAEIVKTAVTHHISADRGIIFDGTPRTVEESKLVDEFFVEQKYGDPLVIYLTVDKDEMIKRNSKRKFCLGILGDFPIADEEDAKQCADKGGVVGKRPDDDPEMFATRWDEFMNRTYPVIEKYKKQGIVNEIDGMKSIDEVHQKVMEVIAEKKRK